MTNELSSSAEAPEIPAPGATDAYRLGQRLHAGSTGEIYEAEHPWLPGRYAIKVLAAGLAQVPHAIQTFRAELGALADTRHPNIIQTLESGVLPDGRPFVIMERLEGRTLTERLADGKPMALTEVLPLVKSVVGALQAAHARAVVHRELATKNIYLATADGYEHGFVKVLNFGIARLRNASGGDAGVGAEAARTMAPEQAQGRSDDVDASTDQFALAAIVYRMLAGHDAFRGDDFIAILYQVVHQDPPPIPGVSTHVDAAVRRALAKDRGNRHDSVTAFYQALEEAANQPPIEVMGKPEGPSAGERATPKVRVIEARPVEFPHPGDAPTPVVLRAENVRPVNGTPVLASAPERRTASFANSRPAGGGVLVVEPPWSAVGVDDDLVSSEELMVPRSRWRLLLFFGAFLLPIFAAALWTGWRPPQSWRQSLHLSGSEPSGPPPTTADQPAVVPAIAVDASPPDSGVDATSSPDAEPSPPDAAAHAQVVKPAIKAPAVAVVKKKPIAPAAAAHKDMVWSDRLQRLVPADGSEDSASSSTADTSPAR